MNQQVDKQKDIFEHIYSPDNAGEFDFHITTDPLTRYLRDRRLNKALREIRKRYADEELAKWKVLSVCGGVGGEAIYFKRKGFNDVTVSDISENSLRICKMFDPAIATTLQNAEELSLADEAYDLVVVQDGLHHLPRPVSGFTEMIRVASKAVVVIEPHLGVVGKLIGTEWEQHEDSINFVFRWDREMITQIVKSYRLKKYKEIQVLRFWDHNLTIGNLVKKLPKSLQLGAAKFFYGALSLFDFAGNMMVAVVFK